MGLLFERRLGDVNREDCRARGIDKGPSVGVPRDNRFQMTKDCRGPDSEFQWYPHNQGEPWARTSFRVNITLYSEGRELVGG